MTGTFGSRRLGGFAARAGDRRVGQGGTLQEVEYGGRAARAVRAGASARGALTQHHCVFSTAGVLRVRFHQRRRLPRRARRPTTRPAGAAGTAHRPEVPPPAAEAATPPRPPQARRRRTAGAPPGLNGALPPPPPARAVPAAAVAAGAHPLRGEVDCTLTGRRGGPRCSWRCPGPAHRRHGGCAAPAVSRDARRARSRVAAVARGGRRPAWRDLLRKQLPLLAAFYRGRGAPTTTQCTSAPSAHRPHPRAADLCHANMSRRRLTRHMKAGRPRGARSKRGNSAPDRAWPPPPLACRGTCHPSGSCGDSLPLWLPLREEVPRVPRPWASVSGRDGEIKESFPPCRPTRARHLAPLCPASHRQPAPHDAPQQPVDRIDGIEVILWKTYGSRACQPTAATHR